METRFRRLFSPPEPVPPDWARTGPRKDRGGKQVFFPYWRAQNPKPAKPPCPTSTKNEDERLLTMLLRLMLHDCCAECYV